MDRRHYTNSPTVSEKNRKAGEQWMEKAFAIGCVSDTVLVAIDARRVQN